MELIKSELNNGRLKRVYSLKDEPVCAKEMSVKIKDNKILDVQITGGCEGNAQGLINMLIGADIDETIYRLSDIDCHNKGTSCPDCLAQILEEMKECYNG